ncbi:uncharacterized protein LOC127843788 [Dreissena polymorpha]|uniref:Uncharacterized protein n=1 Tax=Dreissena polymorpha TaxID=45954 RepID=A0A9D4EJ23_DREPO|nr:uncharacterized protein LOC127843788 [Dreissena polymorpha]KAH3778907.1 hypothetical protein DPMN_180384 [Dreissena polymorpha]
MKMKIIFVVFGILHGSCSAGDCPQCYHVGLISNQPLGHDDEEALEKVTNFDCAENKFSATTCSSGDRCFSFYSVSHGRGFGNNSDLKYTMEIIERGWGKLVQSTVKGICENSINGSPNKIAAALQLALSQVSNVNVTGEECDGSKTFQLQVPRSGANGRNSSTNGSLLCAFLIIFATFM